MTEASRKRFVTMAAGAGATAALAGALAACGDDGGTSTADGTGGRAPRITSADLDVLNFLLVIEYLEQALFLQALESEALEGHPLAGLVSEIAQTDEQHVAALGRAIQRGGGIPAARPATDLDEIISNGPDAILSTAASLKNVVVAAYLGQISKLESTQALVLVLSTHTVEARHAAALNRGIGRAFEEGDQLEGSIPDGALAAPLESEPALELVQSLVEGGQP